MCCRGIHGLFRDYHSLEAGQEELPEKEASLSSAMSPGSSDREAGKSTESQESNRKNDAVADYISAENHLK